jgi:hypothetical protein
MDYPFFMTGSKMRNVLAGVALAWACLASGAHAVGLMVMKGQNTGPEFARVLPIGKCEKFAVSYKVQVPGKTEMVFTVDQVFDVVEYDPEILQRDLVEPVDFGPIENVITKAKSLAATYPAMRSAVPPFIKPLEEALTYRDQGLVHFRQRWIRRAEYDKVLADEKRMVEENTQRMIKEEQERLAEKRRKEDMQKAIAAAQLRQLQEEEKARKQAAEERAAATMRAEAERKREAAETAERLQRELDLSNKLSKNLIAMATQPTGAIARAEWDRLTAARRPDGSTFPGFKGEGSTLATLTEEHFPHNKTPLPPSFGMEFDVSYQTSQDMRNMLVMLTGPKNHTGCIMAFDLPVDAQGMPEAGSQTQKMMAALGDISASLAHELPRALGACLSSLAKLGVLSVRAPIGDTGTIGGYVALTKSRLSDDGNYRATALIVLGFVDEK